MKTNTTFLEILIIAILIAPLVYLGISWNQLPADMTTHYDLAGKAYGWMTKEQATLFTVGTSVLLYLVLRFLPRIDPKGRLQTANYQKLRLVMTMMLSATIGWLVYSASHTVASETHFSVLMVIVSLMFAGIGNYITTVKPNWFVGIRTPWTLGNEAVWRKTHRVGGLLMVAGGLVSTVVSLLIPMPYKVGVILAVVLLVSIVCVVYSYIYFQEEKTHQPN